MREAARRRLVVLERGHGNVLVRPYLKNSVGRYPCLEADDSDLVGAVQIQIWDCPTSQMREWRLRKAS